MTSLATRTGGGLLVLLVVVGVRHLGDVRTGPMTYAAMAAGLDPTEVPAEPR
ncbi:hypothetical protein ACFYWO_39930 [Streptomyces sp. NPDC002932]|uniref:hypothetical protein n=1 Tax=Streptomyces sp. NPDC002932 TaxID=3364672 RepID=UPI0036CBCB77